MEILKDLNEAYASLISFWEIIAPTFMFNILFIILFPLITGIKIISIESLENWLNGTQFARLKSIGKTIGFDSKITWISLLIILLVYLGTFTGIMNLILQLDVPYLRPEKFDVKLFYKQSQPIDDLAVIGRFSAIQPASFESIMEAKRLILANFQQSDPVGYSEFNDRISSILVKNITIYKFIVISTVLSALLFIFHFRKNKSFFILIRWILFLSINIFLLIKVNSYIQFKAKERATLELEVVSNFALYRYRPDRGFSFDAGNEAIPQLKLRVKKELENYQPK